MYKLFLIFLLCLFSVLIKSQKYVFLNDLTSNFKVTEFTLKTQTLYELDNEIKIYNVFLSENYILLFSVLPDIGSSENWVKTEESAFKNKLISKNKILSFAHNWMEENKPNKKTFEFNIVKKLDGEFYVSKVCLTELFKIQKTDYPIISSYGTININEERFKIRQMKVLFEKQFPNEYFILDPRNHSNINNLDISYMKKYYISKVFRIKKQKAYQFWTLDNWKIQDGYNVERGIDRFVFTEKFGIIGGSYDFYFEHKPKNFPNNYYFVDKELLWSNIYKEKVMVAQELLD